MQPCDPKKSLAGRGLTPPTPMASVPAMYGKPHSTRTRWGGLIAARRRQANLSQADLATRIGVRRATISAWEADRASPRGQSMQLLIGELGITGEELVRVLVTDADR